MSVKLIAHIVKRTTVTICPVVCDREYLIVAFDGQFKFALNDGLDDLKEQCSQFLLAVRQHDNIISILGTVSVIDFIQSMHHIAQQKVGEEL